MKRVFFVGLLSSCLLLSACKTTSGVKGNKYNDNSSSSSMILEENSDKYFNTVVKNKVYFETNRDVLDANAQDILAAQASWLKTNSKCKAIIEGHCDERGTREYNLALGERRANMAKRELVKNGIHCDRLRTVSYGKERPEVEGSNDSAYAMNRRAVTVLHE